MSQKPVDGVHRIQRLSLQLANQIAAGEVVERPASVVKELMENALDAKSTSIVVDILQGGIGLIRVSDNGVGIKREDMHLAVSRHATSKLKQLEQLENIISLGFRGEALASISSVSRLSIQSKSRDENSKSWCIDTGNDTEFANYKAELMPSNLSKGTMLEVRDLFFNTPARRKFLRSEKTEFRYIEDVFKRIALSFYSVSFQLSHNKKIVKKLAAVSDEKGRRQRLEKLFGSEFCQAAIQVDFESQDLPDLGKIKIWGWIAGPEYLRQQSNQQYFYVNGRFVKDKLLNHALRQVYQELIPSNLYAAYVLYLSIDPCQVDVNVHPTKHEVRFRHARMVHDFIVSALTQTIHSDGDLGLTEPNQELATEPVYEQHPGLSQRFAETSTPKYAGNHYSISERSTPTRSEVRDNLSGLEKLYQVDKTSGFNPQRDDSQNIAKSVGYSTENRSLIKDNSPIETKTDEPIGNPLTVIDNKILVAECDSLEGKNELWLIDMVECMSIINQNSLIRDFQQEKELATIRLLIPECVELTEKKVEIMLAYQDLIQKFGLKFTQSGPDSIMVREMAKLPFRVEVMAMLNRLVAFLDTDLFKKEIVPQLSLNTKNFDTKKRLNTHLAEIAQQFAGPIYLRSNSGNPGSDQVANGNMSHDKKLFLLKSIRQMNELKRFCKVLNNKDLEKMLLTP